MDTPDSPTPLCKLIAPSDTGDEQVEKMEVVEINEDTFDDSEGNISQATEPIAPDVPQNDLLFEEISFGQSPTSSQDNSIDGLDENEDETTTTSLVYTKHMKIEVKDVFNEVRALKEVERFLENPTILLNINETRLDDIIERTLKKLIANNEGCVVDGDDARNAFFTKDSVHHLSQVIQGTEKAEGSGWEEAQNWLIAMAEVSWINRSYVAMSTLSHATNLGRTLQEAHLVVLILSPRKTKKTKSSLETGRTLATILSDIEIRQQLIASETEEQFLNVLFECKQAMASGEYQRLRKKNHALNRSSFLPEKTEETSKFSIGSGIVDDVRRRWPHYYSDFTDGIRGHRTPHKLASTVFFLYFACLLPSIAFGVLNSKNTQGKIGVKQVIISQSISGVLYTLLSGQPLIVLLTTAPLALYVKVMYDICEDMDLDFPAMYTMTGLWNTFFLALYSLFGASYVMRWCTRSINEIFALFISVAFAVASFESLYKEYSRPSCRVIPLYQNITNVTSCYGDNVNLKECFCTREGGILYILLCCGCVLLGVTLYNFKKSPLLDANKREALADYALPVSVILFSFVGSFIFKDVKMNKESYDVAIQLSFPSLSSLSVGAILGSCGLGFSLSLLFFVEQNIGSAIVNSPSNRLKKGTAYHLDLMVIGVLNGFLSLFGLPWVHAALPHSPLHVRALADVEERVDQGHVFEIIVKVRETRLSILISHILIGLSMLMIPSPLGYIPNAVLDGLFLFVAITPLYNNQMFERSMLLVTEQSAYPPNHYIRRVPQRKIHQYTGIQLLQLAIICGFGFLGSSYTKMFFPVLLILLVPVRHALVPKMIDHKFLDAMDANL